MRHVVRMVTLLVCLSFVSVAYGQQSEITVGDIQTPSLRWGKQIVYVPLVNTTDYVKFVSVVTKISFQGAYLHPERSTRTNYILEPSASLTVNAPIDIPGSFGEATMTVSLYDVVDTMDLVLPYQRFFEQPFTLHFHIPDGLAPYLQDKVSMPPMVGSSPDFDNEFSRVLLVLLSERKSVSQIAEMAMADSSYIQGIITDFENKEYTAGSSGTYTLKFPVIASKEADEGRLLANKASAELASMIQKNLPLLIKCRDSLVAAGKMSKDSNGFLDPGSVL